MTMPAQLWHPPLPQENCCNDRAKSMLNSGDIVFVDDDRRRPSMILPLDWVLARLNQILWVNTIEKILDT